MRSSDGQLHTRFLQVHLYSTAYLDDTLVKVFAQQEVDPRRYSHAVQSQHLVETLRYHLNAEQLAREGGQMLRPHRRQVDCHCRARFDEGDGVAVSRMPRGSHRQQQHRPAAAVPMTERRHESPAVRPDQMGVVDGEQEATFRLGGEQIDDPLQKKRCRKEHSCAMRCMGNHAEWRFEKLKQNLKDAYRSSGTRREAIAFNYMLQMPHAVHCNLCVMPARH